MLARRRWLCLLPLAWACKGDGATPPPDADYQLAAPPAAPAGPAGSRLLAVPLAVVRNSAGQVVAGASVTLSFTTGAGSGFELPETRAASGPDGVVRADVQLGSEGQAELRVRPTLTTSTSQVTVTVTAGPAPTLVSLAPTTFAAGDELQLTGTGLTGEAAGLAVHVGGVRATILEASATAVRVRAPACVAPGQVTVTASLAGGATTNALAGTYAGGSAQASLEPFESVTVPAARVAECLSLLGGGARYLVVPQYATRDDVPDSFRDGARFGFQLGAPSLGPVASRAALLALDEGLSAQQRLDRALRQREQTLAPLAAAAGPNPPLDGPPLAAATVGSTRNFKVLNDLEGDTFTDVTATLRFEGDRIQVYVDNEAPTGGFTQTQLDALGRLFDDKLYPAAVETFGSESDVDRNGHVVVLFTPVVNRLTTAAECAQAGYVTGFFYGLDLLTAQRNSNRAEIFYALVPDPSGSTGSCGHPVQEVLQIVPATFIHEFQHMISWHQKVMVRGSTSDEDLWLNEGLSHIAEEMGSMLYEVPCAGISTPPCRTSPQQLFPDSSQGYILGNFTNAYRYLESSTGTSLVLGTENGSLRERGAAFLFLRWLGDQKGTGIYRRLVESRLRGVENVEDKTGEPWERLFGDFSIALYAADRLPGVAPGSVPDRYRFLSRDLRAIFNRLYETNTTGVTRSFPILAPLLPVNGSVTNTMVPGTMTWYQLQTLPDTPRATITFAPAAPAFDARLGAQVSILRLP